jgi:hypothetical protein
MKMVQLQPITIMWVHKLLGNPTSTNSVQVNFVEDDFKGKTKTNLQQVCHFPANCPLFLVNHKVD